MLAFYTDRDRWISEQSYVCVGDTVRAADLIGCLHITLVSMGFCYTPEKEDKWEERYWNVRFALEQKIGMSILKWQSTVEFIDVVTLLKEVYKNG